MKEEWVIMDAKPSFSWWALLLCAGALVAQDDADSESPTITSLDEIEVTAPDGDTFIDYTVGRFYSDRLDDYMRLDFRTSRISRVGPGELTLFLDIRNMFNRENPRASLSAIRTTANALIALSRSSFRSKPGCRCCPRSG